MKTKHDQDLPLWVYVLMFSTQLLLCLTCIAVVETLLTRLGEERSNSKGGGVSLGIRAPIQQTLA